MIYRVEIGLRPEMRDPRGEHLAAQVRDFLGIPVRGIRARSVYHVEADLTRDEIARVAATFADPVIQEGAVGRLPATGFDCALSVAFRPGVADPVGKSALVAIEDLLGRSLGGGAVYSSSLYLVDGASPAETERIAFELVANPLIESAMVADAATWLASAPDLAVPTMAAEARPSVTRVDLSGSDAVLEKLSRDGSLALSVAELHAIRDHFRRAAGERRRRRAGLGPEPTDVELEALAQTWSEHCKHKIFNARIRYREEGSAETIDSLFATFIRGTTGAVERDIVAREGRSWLVSLFHDNAGVVEFDERVHLVYKVETHNSPSALDPYGGAITGIVGVNRDPFGTGRGADLLVNVWGYCFAPPFWDRPLPAGLLHPRRVRDGVHRGVIDGGNQSGIPYGRGWELFDARYLGKPLVFCGTVGALPVTIGGRPGAEKSAQTGDAVVMVGGRIGADGIHGATFSSAALDETSPARAVQIGDPITQKMMFDFLLEARELDLYSAITDNGAGGLSSSVGEMARQPGGARIELARAPLKYPGLEPWEILLSEAQERMTLAVPPDRIAAFLELAARRGVEATVLGEFTGDGYFEVRYEDEIVALLEMSFLHDGAPRLELEARWQPPRHREPERPEIDPRRALLALLARPNLASGEAKARHYDHEVKGLTAVKPWIGVEGDVPAEATVFLAHHHSLRGFVLSEGVNPFLSDIDPQAMAESVVDEAVRRQVAAGARLDRIAALDNFCWPDPVRSAATPDGEHKLAQLVRACRGLARACRGYGVPLISGKDSMKNDVVLGGVKISVPPTLLVSAIGQIDDVRRAVTLEPKAAGDGLWVLGETGEDLGASEFLRYLGELAGEAGAAGATISLGGRAPVLDPERSLRLYRALAAEIAAGRVRSAAVIRRGGLGLALARAALAGGLGLELELDAVPGAAALAADTALFAESNGRFLVSVAAGDADAFERGMAQTATARVGTVLDRPVLAIRQRGELAIEVGIDELRSAYRGGLRDA